MIVYRASELGMCVRAHVARRLGYREMGVPEVLENAFARGVEHEEECITRMTDEGWGVSDKQLLVQLPISEDLAVQGHLDGLCWPDIDTNTRVLEVKAPAAWEKFERAVRTDTWADPLTVKYAWQTSVYMIAMGMECVVACWDGERVKTFVIERPIWSEMAIRTRIGQIEDMAAQGEIGRFCLPSEFDDWSCPFRYLHERAEEDTDRDLDRLARNYEHARIEVKAAEKVVEEIRAQIIEQLGERESVTTAAAKVTRYVTRRENPDRDAMKRDGLWDQYVKVTTSEALRVTLRGDIDAATDS